MGLFSKPTPVYQGQTYRREVVKDITPYAGAWRNGDDKYSAGGDYVARDVGKVTGNVPRYAKSTYKSARFSSNSVYGASDGSYLQNTKVIGDGFRNRINRKLGVQTSESGLDKRDTNAIVRYVEDPKGTYGVSNYNGRNPSEFLNLQRFDIQSTSGKTSVSKKPKGERNASSIQQSAHKRKNTVGTSKFRIELGGATRTSGLGIPTV